MKKLISIIVVIALVGVLAVTLLGCLPRSQKLYVLNWDDYIDEDIGTDFSEFEAYYKEVTGERIEVVYDTFARNEDMTARIIDGKEDFDVICPSDYAVTDLLNADMLQKLDKSLIPNYSNIDPATQGHAFDLNNEYTAGYMWGTLGVLYNTDHVDIADLEQYGYGVLFGEVNYGKMVVLKDSIRDLIAAAALYVNRDAIFAEQNTTLRYNMIEDSINLTNTSLIGTMQTALTSTKARSVLFGWEVDSGKEEMIQNRAWVNLAWSGDAVYAMEENEALDYYIPEEGSNLWVDTWVIHKNAVNVKAAHMFIDYMLRPDVAQRNMDYIGYTSVVDKEILMESGLFEDEFFENTVRYPTQETLDRCAPMLNFANVDPDSLTAFWNAIKR